MNQKSLIWMGVFIGGAIGGYIPVIFGANNISMSAIFGSAIGSFVGIWIGYKVSQSI